MNFVSKGLLFLSVCGLKKVKATGINNYSVRDYFETWSNLLYPNFFSTCKINEQFSSLKACGRKIIGDENIFMSIRLLFYPFDWYFEVNFYVCNESIFF
jgi:hypothetical protein